MASTTIRYAKLDANLLFVDANAAANNVDAASISRPPGHSIVPGAIIDSGPSDEDQFDRAVASSAEQEEKELARFQVLRLLAPRLPCDDYWSRLAALGAMDLVPGGAQCCRADLLVVGAAVNVLLYRDRHWLHRPGHGAP